MKLIGLKYAIKVRHGRPIIVKASTGVPIPEDEPLILFRARDRNALAMLEAYREICEADQCTPEHIAGIRYTYNAFREFRNNQPERMKQPGISRDTKLP